MLTSLYADITISASDMYLTYFVDISIRWHNHSTLDTCLLISLYANNISTLENACDIMLTYNNLTYCNNTLSYIANICISNEYKIIAFYVAKYQVLGPVVQSVVSLMSSLRVISLTVLADSIHNIQIFFAEKMWVAFALQKLLTFFQQKISAYLRITLLKF